MPDRKESYTIITNSTPQDELLSLAGVNHKSLDITDLSDLSRLPSRVKAALYSEAERFTAFFEVAPFLYLPQARFVELPNITENLTIGADQAQVVLVPQLRKGGGWALLCVDIFDMPALKSAGCLGTSGMKPPFSRTKTVSLPKLETSNNLYFDDAVYVDLSNLREAAHIRLPNVLQLNLPNLEKASSIDAPLATLVAPKLCPESECKITVANPNVPSAISSKSKALAYIM